MCNYAKTTHPIIKILKSFSWPLRVLFIGCFSISRPGPGAVEAKLYESVWLVFSLRAPAAAMMTARRRPYDDSHRRRHRPSKTKKQKALRLSTFLIQICTVVSQKQNPKLLRFYVPTKCLPMGNEKKCWTIHTVASLSRACVTGNT